MSVPTLPPELWAHIAHNLPPSSLSTLSQVNKLLNNICTNPNLFQNLLPTSTNPVRHFRRHRALYHPPPAHTSIRLTTKLRILCTINDNLLLHDLTTARLIAFPTGVTVDVVRLIGNPPVTHEGLLTRSIFLPRNNIAFVSCITTVRLVVWNVITGDVTVRNLVGGLRAFSKHIIRNRFAAVAGDDGESIIYYIDDDNVVIVEWATRKLVRQISASFLRGPFLLGECPTLPGMTVIGLVSQHGNSSMREIVCKPFNGPTKNFRTVPEKRCTSALRSLDKKTFVLLFSAQVILRREQNLEFIARRTESDSWDKTWYGTLPKFALPQLVDNGRVLSVAYQSETYFGYDVIPDSDPLLRVVLHDDGTVERIGMRKRDGWNPPIWHFHSANDVFAVMVQNKEGLVELFKLDGKNNDNCVKRWSIKERIVNASVVADHFIVATCEHGRLFVWHFDKFCHGASGVYACPGLIPDAIVGAGQRTSEKTRCDP